MDIKQVLFSFFLLSCCCATNVLGAGDSELVNAESGAPEGYAAGDAQCKPQLTDRERSKLNQMLKDALKRRYGFNEYSFFDDYDKTAPLTETIDLLDRGATDNNGRCTPLHLAASYGDVALVRELLKRKSSGNTHARDGHDDTPFLVAAQNVHEHYRDIFSKKEEQEILQSKKITIIDRCLVLWELWHHSTDQDKQYSAHNDDRLYYVRGAIAMFHEIFGCTIEDYDPLDYFEGT